jgi:hypothetical protein
LASQSPPNTIIDVIMEYALARSDHKVEKEDFDKEFHNALVGGGAMGPYMKQFPWMPLLMRSLPDFVLIWAKMSSFIQVTRVSILFYYPRSLNSKDDH